MMRLRSSTGSVWKGSCRLTAGLVLAAGVVARAQAQPEPAPSPTPVPSPVPTPSEPAPSPAPAEPPGGKTPEPKRGDEPGVEIVVYLKNGKSLTGLLLRETREELVLRIAGIETPIETSSIDRYQILPPILERYRQFREAIGNDPDQIATLVSWLQSREQLELALTEVQRLLTIDPHHKQGLALKRSVESQIELRDAARARAERGELGDRDDEPVRPGVPAAREPREPFPLLSDAQINLIKVFEIDMDSAPRILISRETIGRLIDEYSGSSLMPATQEGRDALYRKAPMEILDLMFRLKARDLYGEVEVLDQPRSMRMFRDDVQAGWLVQACATNDCHGGTEAGRLQLLNRKPRSEASAYTNFLILERFRLDDGTALLNYEDPAKSPLLQMALPRQDSTRPHPVVPKGARGHDAWKSQFRNSQERLFERTVAWMKAMYRPRPEYPIEYQPPGASVRPMGGGKEPQPR